MERDIFSGSDNILLTGPAGTGKTYELNRYINSHENVLITAPTGIAAINIGGITMHKAFGIPRIACGATAKDYSAAIVKAIARADTIIIDEISMCRNDNFAFTIKMIRKAEKIKGKKIRIIVSGDFSQLPPVVPKTEGDLLVKHGFDRSGYAFTTPEWKSCKFRVEVLSKVKRQEDLEFVEKLAQIRKGDVTAIEYFNQFVEMFPDDKDAMRVCGTNEEAAEINREYLESLPGLPVAYGCRKEGKLPFQQTIVDEIIILKEGAKVIFTANDVKNSKYFNGMLGIVKKLDPETVTVDVKGTEIQVGRREHPIYDYDAKSVAIARKQVGCIRQIPLKVAKAITIHKSQGQTFDKIIVTPDIFASGQLYVALSRVRSPEGLILTKAISAADLYRNDKVEEFYSSEYGYIPADVPAKKPAKKAPAKNTTAKKSAAKKTTAKKTTSKKTTATKKATTAKKTATAKKPTVTRRATAKSTAKKSGTKTTKTKRKIATANKKAKAIKVAQLALSRNAAILDMHIKDRPTKRS